MVRTIFLSFARYNPCARAEGGLGGRGSSAAAWTPSTMLGTRLEQPQTMRRAAVGMELVLPGCDTTNCAVPGKDSHNNTIRTLERSLLAADTDGYADTESGTSHECAVRVPKGYRD